MDAVTSMRFDHLAKLLIAAKATQLRIGKPLPRRTLVAQVIEKTFRARHQWPILAVWAQTQVHAVEITLSSDTRQRRNHELDKTRISLILRQRLDGRRNHRIVSDQNVEVGPVVDAPGTQTSQSIKRDARSTGERAIAARHFTPRDEIRDVYTRRRQLGL